MKCSRLKNAVSFSKFRQIQASDHNISLDVLTHFSEFQAILSGKMSIFFLGYTPVVCKLEDIFFTMSQITPKITANVNIFRQYFLVDELDTVRYYF